MSTYNGEKFLSDQIESFISQTHRAWHLFVHDDGSSDDTLKILTKYAQQDSRITVLRNEPHMGIKKAFLTLLTKYESPYYAFSDQDDIWDPQKLEKLTAKLDATSSAEPALIYSNFKEIDALNRPIEQTTIAPGNTSYKAFLRINTVTGCTCMMNQSLRNLLIGPLSDINFELMRMHDWWAALAASAFGKVYFLPDQLVAYRQHGSNTIGAPMRKSLITQLKNIVTLSDRYFLNGTSRQAQLFSQIYGQYLTDDQRTDCETIATLFESWHPFSKHSTLVTSHLLMKDKTFNYQTNILLLVPSKIRNRHLK
ncbi:glycosyltransferase family 2 protein [Lacticaseibacillus suibinensis]|uniref:glycosyltransferase family 2 protein n=1 Tax=Lacticaseibacillus suibinensis TaxID=2486011 RepID=UPI0013DE0027|nr:glycosyltransferase family 2 protein [Lacticaseibacillus suibinensis]